MITGDAPVTTDTDTRETGAMKETETASMIVTGVGSTETKIEVRLYAGRIPEEASILALLPPGPVIMLVASRTEPRNPRRQSERKESEYSII